MPIPEKNNKGETVLSLSRSQMSPRKRHAPASRVKCECSTCGEIAFVIPDSPHQYCRGLKLSPIAKVKFPHLKLTNRKGTWKVWSPKVEAPKVEAPKVEAQPSETVSS